MNFTVKVFTVVWLCRMLEEDREMAARIRQLEMQDKAAEEEQDALLAERLQKQLSTEVWNTSFFFVFFCFFCCYSSVVVYPLCCLCCRMLVILISCCLLLKASSKVASVYSVAFLPGQHSAVYSFGWFDSKIV